MPWVELGDALWEINGLDAEVEGCWTHLLRVTCKGIFVVAVECANITGIIMCLFLFGVILI